MGHSTQIDDALSSVVVAQMLFLEAESSAPISLYINSPGGSVTAGLAIYDTVRQRGTQKKKQEVLGFFC